MAEVWTKESILAYAETCSTLKELHEKKQWAMKAAKRLGIDEEIKSMFTKLHRDWTYDDLVEEASKYGSSGDFRSGTRAAYNICIKRGILREVCAHLNRPAKVFWTKESCIEAAKKCKTRKEFQRKFRGAYGYARSNGFVEDVWEFIPEQVHIWTKEECHTEALKYGERRQFQMLSKNAYNFASRRGWLDEICSHMLAPHSLVKRCVYAYEFPDNCVYVGLTYNFTVRHWEHTSEKASPVKRHKDETGLIPTHIMLHDYCDTKEAQKLEDFYINKYKEEGWTLLNKNKAGSLGSPRVRKVSVKNRYEKRGK